MAETNQFSGMGPPPPPPGGAPALAEDSKVVARVRLVEERLSDIRASISLIEQNMIANNRRLLEEIKVIKGDINGMKDGVRNMQEKITDVIRELSLTASRDDVDVLKRYVDLLQPSRIATIDKVEELINERLGRKE